jgi:tRNA dimethylallyltransferase
LEEARNQAVAATRQLAKRQVTWLRQRERAQRFDSMQPQVAGKMIDALLKGGFTGFSDTTRPGSLC